MDKLISSEKLIHDLSGIRDTLPDIFLKNVMSAAISCVEKQPTVDTESVRPGRWENITGGMITLGDCAECKARQPVFGTNYCKNCGAKMDLEV